MSKSYYKSFGRKGLAPVSQTSIQFDKLFCENSNRPSASKSAGVVGKWGITSFTSLRSSSFSLGRKDDNKYKRSYGESKSKASGVQKEAAVVAPLPQQPRPKKFFKSRNNDSESTPAQTATPPLQSPSPVRRYNKQLQRSSSAPSNKKGYRSPPTEDEDEEDEDDDCLGDEENRESVRVTRASVANTSPPTVPQQQPSHNPPIVLRIFKGTAQLLTDEAFHQHSNQTQQHHHHHHHKKEGRRRSHSGSHEDGVSPKRPKMKVKDIESLRKDLEDEEPSVQEVFQPNKELVEEECYQLEAESMGDSPLNDDQKDREKLLRILEGEENDSQERRLEAPPVPPPPKQDPEVEEVQPSEECKDDKEDILKNLTEESVFGESEVQESDLQGSDMQGSDEQGSEVQGPDVQGSEVQGPDVQGSEVQGPDTKVETTDAEPLPVSLPPEPEPLCASEEPQPQPQSEPQPQPPKAAARLPRKGCIFKSRGASGEKRQAHYIHKWSDVKEPEGAVTQDGKTPSLTKPKVDAEFEPETLTRITSYHMSNADLDDDSEPITSVTCSKRSKEFYTVVRNVKKAHQIQESGEFQEFNDDVEYILDALQDNNPISTRCLSAITLASKCMVPAFRMHVRAHGTVTKFFKALHDATKDQRLGMCTATVMFVLSQDRLNMDVDRDSLELMLNLLESDTSHNSALDDCGLSDVQLQKTKERVRSLCQEIQEQGHGKHLNLDNITVGHLAMETLLSLTSRRAGEWFKEELRDLGGLEHIIKTVVDTCEPVLSSVTDWTPQLMDRLRKADRCLRVLENVTLHNEENNNYLLTYGEGILVDTVVRVFRVCDDSLASHPVASPLDKHSVGAVIRDCLMSILKVLINLTHDFNNKSFGSALAGKRQGVIEASLHVIMAIPEYVPEEQKFDFIILALILLINLIEHCDSNRKLLMEARVPSTPTFVFSDCEQESAVSALVSLFLQHEELARTEEKKTDAILDGEKPIETQQQKSQEEFIEETVAVLLQKAGRHMEHTLVGAYVAILLGYMTLENEEYERLVRSYMPNRSYEVMLSVLQKFYNFMTLTAAAGSVSSKGIKSTEMLIKHLTEIDKAALTTSPSS